MQIIAVSALIIIVGLIGALLGCAARLVNGVRTANTTLRRIEEALLSLNRVKAMDSSIKSAEPLKQSQPADTRSVDFLTVRELKTMSSRDRQSANGATGSNTDLHSALGRERAPAVESPVVRAVPEVGQGGRQGDQTAPTRTALDEGLRKKREREALMIISSRRRRARA